MTTHQCNLMTAEHDCECRGGGENYIITLTNGAIVRVWDRCIDNGPTETDGIIEIYSSRASMENGDEPDQIIVKGDPA